MLSLSLLSLDFCRPTGIPCNQIDLLSNDTAWQGQAQSMFPAIRRLEDRRWSRGIDGLCRLLIGITRIQLALLRGRSANCNRLALICLLTLTWFSGAIVVQKLCFVQSLVQWRQFSLKASVACGEEKAQRLRLDDPSRHNCQKHRLGFRVLSMALRSWSRRSVTLAFLVRFCFDPIHQICTDVADLVGILSSVRNLVWRLAQTPSETNLRRCFQVGL